MAWTDNLIFWLTHDESSGTRRDPHGGHEFIDVNSVGSAQGINGNASLLVRANNEYLVCMTGILGFDPMLPWTYLTRFYVNTEQRNGGFFGILNSDATEHIIYISINPEKTKELNLAIKNTLGGNLWIGRTGTIDALTFGAWHTLRVEFDGGPVGTTNADKTRGRIFLDNTPYLINGESLGTSGYISTPGGGDVPPMGPAVIGYGPSHTRYFDGMFDDSVLLQRHLSTDEISEYESGASYYDVIPKISSLVSIPGLLADLDPERGSFEDEAGTTPATELGLVSLLVDSHGSNDVTKGADGGATLKKDDLNLIYLDFDGVDDGLRNSTTDFGNLPHTHFIVFKLTSSDPSLRNEIIYGANAASRNVLQNENGKYRTVFGTQLRESGNSAVDSDLQILTVVANGANSYILKNNLYVISGDSGPGPWKNGNSGGLRIAAGGVVPAQMAFYRAATFAGVLDGPTLSGVYDFLRVKYSTPASGGPDPEQRDLVTGQAIVSGNLLDITEGTPPVVPQLAGVTAIALEFESANPALDATGHTTPVEVNDVLVNESGFIGASALFTGGARRHFVIPDGPYSRNGDRSWTYAFMLNPHNLSNRPYLLCKPFDEDDFELAIRLQSTGVMLAQVGNGVERQYHETVATVPIDSWTGVFVGFDDVNRVLEISFNNAEPESWDITVPTGIAPTDLVIGLKDPTSLNFNLNGEIDQLFKFDKFLTPEDKAWIWNNGNWRTAAEVLSTGGGQNVILSTGVTNASGFLLDLTEGQIRSLSLAIANLTGENVNVVEGVIRTLSLGQADTHGEFLGIRQGESRVIQTGFVSPQGELINISLGSQERILNIGIASALGELLKVQDTAQGRRLSTGQAKSEGFELSISTGQIRSLSFAIAQATGQPLEVVQAQVRNLVLGSANATGQSLAVQLASNTITLSTGSVGVPGDDLEFTLGQLITLSTGIAVSTGLPLHVAAIRILSMGEARSMGYTLHIGERFIPSSIGVRHRMSRIYTSVHSRKPITVRFRNG